MRIDLSRLAQDATALVTSGGGLFPAATVAIVFLPSMLVAGNAPGKAQALDQKFGDLGGLDEIIRAVFRTCSANLASLLADLAAAISASPCSHSSTQS